MFHVALSERQWCEGAQTALGDLVQAIRKYRIVADKTAPAPNTLRSIVDPGRLGDLHMSLGCRLLGGVLSIIFGSSGVSF
jgi:hypothetical protein